jgi:arylsulfatase
MAERPHLIFIITDQQRSDTIGALGAPWMHTPALDRLAREGAAFRNCFVTSPVCVGSRASLFTGMYPHAGGVFTNFHPWEPSWVRWLAEAGYHCASIGKMHINPYDALGGFHQRFVVENKDRPLFLEEHDRAFYDEWDKALHARRLVKPSRYSRYTADPEGYRSALGAFAWHLDEDMHSDMFVGDHAIWWLEERKATSPLFLQVGFPGPHPPYDPVPRHLKRYASAELPVPELGDEELALQPRSQAALRENMIRNNYDSVAWRHRPARDDLLRLRRHYAANVSMIDEKVGQILEVLGRKGYLDNAIVVFTSDHADALGEHDHIQKWTMYDCVERVPLVFWSPRHIPAAAPSDDLVQLMDVAATLLEAAGVPVPANWEARSLWPALSRREPCGREVVYAELARDHIQTATEYIVMRRDRDWKLVYYLGEPDGELFDLGKDPQEIRNLWSSSEHRGLRDDLVRALQEWSMRATLRSRMPAQRRPQQPMLI